MLKARREGRGNSVWRHLQDLTIPIQSTYILQDLVTGDMCTSFSRRSAGNELRFLFLTALALLLGLAVLFLCLATDVEGTTLYVDDDAAEGGDGSLEKPFEKIQDAVNASEDGDTVRVFAGTYHEELLVNTSVDLIGNGSSKTTVEGQDQMPVVNIQADWVNISGFSIEAPQDPPYSRWTDAGIFVGSSNVTVTNNTCLYSMNGIRNQYDTDNVTISFNTCLNNLQYGIWTQGSFTTVTNNICRKSERGIYARSLDNSMISGNELSHNQEYGLEVGAGDWENVEITGNIIINNPIGIKSMSGVNFTGNILENNSETGFYLPGREHVLRDNRLVNCGISFWPWPRGDEDWENMDIDQSNTVNGKPVLCLVGVRDKTFTKQAGQVTMVNCSNITIENQDIVNATMGFWIVSSSNITINNCSSRENSIHGLALYDHCENISINRSNFTGNTCRGLEFVDSGNITMKRCFVTDNTDGVRISACDGIFIWRCEMTRNTDYGVTTEPSSLHDPDGSSTNCSFKECNFYYNGNYGAWGGNLTGNWWGSPLGPTTNRSRQIDGRDMVAWEGMGYPWLEEKVDILGVDPEGPEPADEDELELDLGFFALILLLCSSVCLGVVLGHSEPFRYALLRLFTPFYTRLNPAKIESDIAQQNVRGRIYQFIKDNPGIHLSAIAREVKVGHGTTVYHLAVLERERYLRSATAGPKKQFWVKADFPFHGEPTLTELQRNILETLKEGELSRSDLVEKLGVSKSTLVFNIKQLVELGKLKEERRGKESVCSLVMYNS